MKTTTDEAYLFIKGKIDSMKSQYKPLRDKKDDYVFSALCLKNNIYKNPSFNFSEDIITDAIVDSQGDGGADILLSDPGSDASDLLICQSKFYTEIDNDQVKAAIRKMVAFYNTLSSGSFEQVNQNVANRFGLLNAEVGDESKVKFIFYTSALGKKRKIDQFKNIVKDAFDKDSRFDCEVYFGEDIEEEIKEAESRRPSVEAGQLTIDKANNVLYYGDNAIVNISGFSLKQLWTLHLTNLFSRNLRFFIKKGTVDTPIKDTIENAPSEFWFRNNGITIVCDDFNVDGKILKLKNFSIVNGGQTTTLIAKSSINKDDDSLFLPCKIIKTRGETEDEKNAFSLTIAQATNSQKPIKPLELKANAPEQIRFSKEMRELNIFYQTKRGEVIPNDYKEGYQNTDLADIGKLCLAGIFQLPAKSRNKPTCLSEEAYYDVLFLNNGHKITKISRDLLYIDYYFRKIYSKNIPKNPSFQGPQRAFANNARTICIAFVALAARYQCKNIDQEKLNKIFESVDSPDFFNQKGFIAQFTDLDFFNEIFLNKMFLEEREKIDAALNNLFDAIIKEGVKAYQYSSSDSQKSNESNYLKKDINYYRILKGAWPDLEIAIKNNDVFSRGN